MKKLQQAGLWAAGGPPPCLCNKAGYPIRRINDALENLAFNPASKTTPSPRFAFRQTALT